MGQRLVCGGKIITYNLPVCDLTKHTADRHVCAHEGTDNFSHTRSTDVNLIPRIARDLSVDWQISRPILRMWTVNWSTYFLPF